MQLFAHRLAWMMAGALIAGSLVAQEPAAPAGGGGASPGGAGGGAGTGGGNTGGGVGRDPGATNPGRTNNPFPDPRQQQQDRFPEMRRPVFLSGKVVLDDGTPPPEPVVIERLCNGQARPEGYTDTKGRFSFALGENQSMMMDASVGSSADNMGPLGSGNSSPGFGQMGGNRGVTERELMGCEIRAVLPGYRSEPVQLSGRRMMDNPDVGTIILRRLGNVEGLTTSMTTLAAPKDAKKSYEKALGSLKKQKLDEALPHLEKAVAGYPKYAIAWHTLGQVYEAKKDVAKAKDAYAKSIEADSKFVKPYIQLSGIAAQEQNWEEVATTTDKVIRLNPVDFPQAYFYNSVANYNLKKFEEAEKSALEAVRLDPQHKMPKAQHILGVLLAMRNDYKGAAENMRGYLKFAPQAGDAEMVRNQLTEIESRLSGGKTEVVETNPNQ